MNFQTSYPRETFEKVTSLAMPSTFYITAVNAYDGLSISNLVFKDGNSLKCGLQVLSSILFFEQSRKIVLPTDKQTNIIFLWSIDGVQAPDCWFC